MARKLALILLVLASLMVVTGCGDRASAADQIDAPPAPSNHDEQASMRDRGLSDDQRKAINEGSPRAGVGASGGPPR